MDQTSFLVKAHKALIIFGGLYVAAVALLAIPMVQRHALFAHYVRWPLSARFEHPEQYGLSPTKTLNFHITTPDNVTIGAWFTLAESAHQLTSASTDGSVTTTQIMQQALRSHKTAIYYHGNAASRAAPFRVMTYGLWSSKLDVNVLAIDYRGFGDSEGSPSEQGLVTDARAAWDWVIENGSKPSDVLVVGQSLGTGVSSKLVSELSNEGTCPRGVVLVAGFTSIATLLETYSIFGLFPVFQPLQLFPFAFKAIEYLLEHKFNSLAVLPSVTCPTFLLHSTDDFDIPIAHSERMYNTIIEEYLPAMPFTQEEMLRPKLPYKEHMAIISDAVAARNAVRTKKEETKDLGGVGVITKFHRDDKGPVTIFKINSGGHNKLVFHESAMDEIRKSFDL